MLKFFKSVFGSKNDREIRKLKPIVTQVNAMEETFKAMDDDELRRGRATTHVAFDEATAILVGDAMQALAFEILVTDPCWQKESQISCKLIEYLAKASGPSGMAGGQAMDLAAAGHTVSVAELDEMYARKTGRLSRAAVRMPLFCNPSTSADTLAATDAYASRIGLAFQVIDDVLNVEGDPSVMGKSVGTDEIRNKSTYPSIMGLEASKSFARSLIDSALRLLEIFDHRADPLRAIAEYIIARKR